MMVSIENLKNFIIFKDLNERELLLLCEIAKEITYEAGIRIFEEKSLARNLHLLLEGKVEIRLRCSDAGYVVIDTIIPGEIFGWSAITDPYTFTASAWTVENTRLIVFDTDAIADLFEKNNHIGYRVVKALASVIGRRVRALETKIASTMCSQ